MSARRGAHIGSHRNTNYLLDLGRKKLQENIVHQKLKHLDDVIFMQSTSFWSQGHQMNYFSMSLLKIETKTYQFCFELNHHGILNEKRLNLR